MITTISHSGRMRGFTFVELLVVIAIIGVLVALRLPAIQEGTRNSTVVEMRGQAMLRITVHDNPQALTFQLEGRVAGPWLRELEECWQSTLVHQRKPILRVDLTGVTFVDEAGKVCLAAMYGQGAELVAADCLTRDIVAEIRQGRSQRATALPLREAAAGDATA